MAIVLVTGASRGLGRETVIAAANAGHSVRALSRSQPDDADPRATWIAGSATDAASMLAAVEGVDTVITCIGASASLAPVTLFSDAARATVAAMHTKSVRRLICVTGLGAGDSSNVGGPLSKIAQKLLLGQVYADKDREEEIVKSSGLDWTIVRPGVLTRFPARGKYRVLTEPASWEAGFITRGDVAAFLVAQIEDLSLVGKTPVVVSD